MKVAVTYENGEVFQQFGRTPQVKVYEITDGRVVSDEVIGAGRQPVTITIMRDTAKRAAVTAAVITKALWEE